MAEMIQFGARKMKAPCALCEEMLAEALDETLSAVENDRFHAHLATCTRCAQMYLEAERGAGWLRLLKTEQPELQEYRTDLVSSILSQTIGSTSLSTPAVPPVLQPVSSQQLTVQPTQRAMRYTQTPVRVPFLRSINRVIFEPRLAMTAAMAFFSIALTLNLTGVQLNQLHARDLNPLNLRRDLYQADAHAVRYYDNLRVVHVLESRVDDLRDRIGDTPAAPDQDTPTPVRTAPSQQNHSAPAAPQSRPEPQDKGPGTSLVTPSEVQPETREGDRVAATSAALVGGVV